MTVILRSNREIGLLRKAGAVVAKVLWKLQQIAEPGVTTAQLDAVAREITEQAGASALFVGVESRFAKFAFP